MHARRRWRPEFPPRRLRLLWLLCLAVASTVLAANVAFAGSLGGLVSTPIVMLPSESDELLAPLPTPEDTLNYQALADALRARLVTEANRIFSITPGWGCIKAGT